MKIIWILLLLGITLLAKNEKTCYTVQLLSVKKNSENSKTLAKKNFPSSCKVMHLKHSIAVRCGCFSKMDSAEDELYKLEDIFTDASITTTYAKRFKTKQKRVKNKKQNSTESCHSVQIFKKKNTQETRDILTTMNFPNNCQEMTIGKSLAVRCGCYKTRKEARVESYILEDDFKNLSLTTTYKYKFDKSTLNRNSKQKQREKKRKKTSTKTCYSVEIFRAKNTQENMGKLLMQEFPSSCINIEIKDKLSIRCGCYNNKKDVIARYHKLKKAFKNSRISNTYVNRFKL